MGEPRLEVPVEDLRKLLEYVTKTTYRARDSDVQVKHGRFPVTPPPPPSHSQTKTSHGPRECLPGRFARLVLMLLLGPVNNLLHAYFVVVIICLPTRWSGPGNYQ